MSSNNLQRMIIIPPEVFDKWKNIITEDQQLSQLDKSMRNIIYNKNLNEIDKWHHYRENLLKFSFANKGKGDMKLSRYVKPITSEKTLQTNRVPKWNFSQQTSQAMENQYAQTIPDYDYVLHNGDYIDKQTLYGANNDEVFEHDGLNSKNDINNDDTSDDGNNEFIMSNIPKDATLLKVRRHTREYSNGDVVTIDNEKLGETPDKGCQTRNMTRKLLNEKNLQQLQIPFKSVKNPHLRPSTKKARISSEGDIIKWDKYN